MSEQHDQLITCPRCGQRFPLDAALAEQLAGPLLASKEAELRHQITQEIRSVYVSDLESMHAELAEKDDTLKEQAKAVKKLQDEEAQLRRERRELEDQKEAIELEQERMRDEIRKQEREDAERRARQRSDEELRRKEDSYLEQLHRKDEEYDTKTRQLEDQLKRVSAQLEEAQRRSETGSRQQEGIARQDLFGEELQQRFPDDEFTITRRGQAGADIIHHVRTGGLVCGVIVWECKRTASWNAAWPDKLAGDVQKAQGDVGVLVSEKLPAKMEGSGLVGGVWVCDFDHAVHLAAGLRYALIRISRYEAANAARADTAGKVYDYIATGDFETRYKESERALDSMRETLGKERRAFEQLWKQREREIETADAGLHGIVLDLIGIGAEIPSAARIELAQPVTPALPVAGG
jgi:hypothetical protein